EACGVAAPSGLRLDGRSFLGLLTGERETWPSRTLVLQTHRGDEPVRYHHFMIRDDRYKLLHASGFGRERFDGEPRFELYDLGEDPGETRDLAKDRPEIVARLKSSYDAWFDDVSTTRPDTFAPPRIHVGTPHESPTVLTRQDWRGGTWARDSSGYWELRVEPGRYDVRFIFEPSADDETAVLQIGTITKRAPIQADSKSASILDVELPGGELSLRVDLESRAGKRRGVYQVEMRRTPKE